MAVDTCGPHTGSHQSYAMPRRSGPVAATLLGVEQQLVDAFVAAAASPEPAP